MKCNQRKFLATISVFLFGVLLVAGCRNEKSSRTENRQGDLLSYTVMHRIDKQNEVYYQLAQMIEDFAVSNDRAIEDVRFRSFCMGINCFIRDGISSSWFEQLYQEDKALLETIEDLIDVTAKYEMETLQISKLSDDKLEQLKINFYELAKCCDRGEENSLAFHLSIQDCKSESYHESVKQTQKLLLNVQKIIERKGAITK